MTVTVYTPPPSLKGFLVSEKFVSLVTGPVGSGKSSAAMVKIAYHAKRMKPGPDGIRRSRAVVVRNTKQMLTDSTLPTFTTWFPDGIAGTYMKTDGRFLLRFDDVACDVLFRGLDDSNDVRRLLSLEVSFGVLDEFREINKDIFYALQGRIGRYPSKKDGGCVTESGEPNFHLWGASNAPDYGSFWEELLSDPPDTVGVFRQPSALSAEADWLAHLPDNYYDNLADGKSEDWCAVYIHNEFGRSLAGQPVHRAFRRDIHVAKSALKYNPVSSQPLVVGMDLALNPAAVIGQLGFEGRLMVFDCLHAEGMGALRFLRERLKPLLTSKYPGARVLVVCDPSGVRRMDTDERTVVQLIKAEGLAVKPATTNKLPTRLAAVDNFLTRMVDGKPALLIDPDCDTLIRALAGKYRFKTKKAGTDDEQTDIDTPEKLHPWSDVADALQYLCLHADGGAIIGAQALPARREVKPAPYRWAM